eukprot:TRINITY_DN1600_c0_g1_i1.p1 TRINITY_DN1600_c0_g1~~TRINITY_DN1600_c0_g1_i1.p1  ORF type:complete len:278 (-),score=103.72 TRINITY_DN1600_c0_g1_i1:795-1505(-)
MLMAAVQRRKAVCLEAAATQDNDVSALPNVVVRVVVLTGGPCGGKSSAKDRLTRDLRGAGYNVLFCPEVPTLLIQGGAAYPGAGAGARLIEFERQLLRLQLQMEDSFRGMARVSGRKTVVICDRAAMDVKAYLPEAQWRDVLRALGATERALLARYDVVAHLTTAADGAAAHYSAATNAARTEAPCEARALDGRVAAAWSAHARRAVVDNSRGRGFAEKLDAAAAAVLRALAELER